MCFKLIFLEVQKVFSSLKILINPAKFVLCLKRKDSKSKSSMIAIPITN